MVEIGRSFSWLPHIIQEVLPNPYIAMLSMILWDGTTTQMPFSNCVLIFVISTLIFAVVLVSLVLLVLHTGLQNLWGELEKQVAELQYTKASKKHIGISNLFGRFNKPFPENYLGFHEHELQCCATTL